MKIAFHLRSWGGILNSAGPNSPLNAPANRLHHTLFCASPRDRIAPARRVIYLIKILAEQIVVDGAEQKQGMGEGGGAQGCPHVGMSGITISFK